MDIWHLRPHLAIFVNYDLCVNPQTKDRTYWNQYSLTYNYPRGVRFAQFGAETQMPT